MKKFPVIVAAFLMMVLIVPSSDAQVMVRTQAIAPGVTIVKTKPVKPGRNYVWVDGYRHYNPATNRYSYVSGYWVKRRKATRVKAVRNRRNHCH